MRVLTVRSDMLDQGPGVHRIAAGAHRNPPNPPPVARSVKPSRSRPPTRARSDRRRGRIASRRVSSETDDLDGGCSARNGGPGTAGSTDRATGGGFGWFRVLHGRSGGPRVSRKKIHMASCRIRIVCVSGQPTAGSCLVERYAVQVRSRITRRITPPGRDAPHDPDCICFLACRRWGRVPADAMSDGPNAKEAGNPPSPGAVREGGHRVALAANSFAG
jgi:hypothetical protein